MGVDHGCLHIAMAEQFLDPWQLLSEYFAIQEEDGVQRLVLCGCGDVAADGKVAEKFAEVL